MSFQDIFRYVHGHKLNEEAIPKDVELSLLAIKKWTTVGKVTGKLVHATGYGYEWAHLVINKLVQDGKLEIRIKEQDWKSRKLDRNTSFEIKAK